MDGEARKRPSIAELKQELQAAKRRRHDEADGNSFHHNQHGGPAPVSNVQCYTCGEMGHFSRNCPNPKSLLGEEGSSNLAIDVVNPEEVSEEMLIQRFSVFGAIGSVRLTDPRPGTAAARAYVNYIDPEDARNALAGLQGCMLGSQCVRLSLTRALRKPKMLPVYIPGSWGKVQRLVEMGGVPTVNVPSDIPPKHREVIDALAVQVARYGSFVEEVVRAREADNPHMTFLTPSFEPAHIYYKWRVFSLLQGDTLSRWRGEPFQMFRSGPLWIPPQPPSTSSPSPEPERRKLGTVNGREPLGKDEWEQLVGLLRGLTTTRASILQGMVWVLEHAASANDVVDVITQSLQLRETPPQTKVARLYLVSDVLHNCGSLAPGAYLFNPLFQSALPTIATAMASDPVVAPVFIRLLRLWHRSGLFPEPFLSQLFDTVSPG